MEVMRQCGSVSAKGIPQFDPMPPRFISIFLSDTTNPGKQTFGWMWMHTFRYRREPDNLTLTEPWRHRTAYAAGEFGQSLGVPDLARHFKWSPAKARKVWAREVQRGWCVKRDG